ncbi:MAG: 4Fe-4S dicluster domain-containing protein [Vulcanimicrobiota bacterium]
MQGKAVVLEKARLDDWVKQLKGNYTVCGPTFGMKEYHFKEIDEDHPLDMNYTRTVIPPKKYLHPQRETLAVYKRGEHVDWDLPEYDKKTVVLGVHPCDARAILTYDVVFGGDIPDPFYWRRRENTIIVATTCTSPDEHCFCLTWDKCGPTMDKEGYDLLMTDIGEKFLIEVGSLEGSMLVQSDLFYVATEEDLQKKEKLAEEIRKKVRRLSPDGNELPDFLKKHYEHPAWDIETQKCVSCGSCTLVCPTCFCYHVEDFNRWNLKDGNRVRIWDSCQLIDFAEVAMGENFRKDRGARLKWRIYHKLAYWPEQFNTFGCTGCGRCIEYCMADIDMTEAIDNIKESWEGGKINA